MHAPTRISIGSRRLGEFTILAPSEKTCVSCQATWEIVFTEPASLFAVERYMFSWPCMHTCTLQNTCVNAVQQENSPFITNACAQKRVRRCSRQAYLSGKANKKYTCLCTQKCSLLFLGIQGANKKYTCPHERATRTRSLARLHACTQNLHALQMPCRRLLSHDCCTKMKMNTRMRIIKISFSWGTVKTIRDQKMFAFSTFVHEGVLTCTGYSL